MKYSKITLINIRLVNLYIFEYKILIMEIEEERQMGAGEMIKSSLVRRRKFNESKRYKYHKSISKKGELT